MFTIIICRQEIIDDCKAKYNSFLKPLMNDKYDFACWNTEANNLEEAVPALQDYLSRHKIWRAIIVSDCETMGFSGISKHNPFDVCEHVSNTSSLVDEETIADFRRRKEESFSRALADPLIRLTNWLMGANIIDYDDPKEVLDVSDEIVDENYFEKICASSFGLYREEKILAYELNRERIIRDELLLEHFGEDAMIDCVPKQVILLAERAVLKKEYTSNYSEEHLEMQYSQFFEDNMYPAHVRFLLYNMKYMNGHRDADNYFSFLAFLNIFAANEYPNDAIKPERVYSAQAVLSYSKLSYVCNAYLSKLAGTKRYIDRQLEKLNVSKKSRLDDDLLENVFEQDVTIPITTDYDHSSEELFCTYSEIGIATDSPIEEITYWSKQYDEIQKHFIRYLREPKRSVKLGVKRSLRQQNKLEDERALKMDEFQQENIYFDLLEREEQMVDTQPGDLFDAKEYKAEIETASKEIIRRIGQRMNKRKVQNSCTIALALFFVSVLPALVDAFVNGGGEAVSAFLLVGGCAAFFGVCLIALLVFKKQLINRFKHFNYVMSGIIYNIEASLNEFSVYLSKACNVMRRFSILNFIENDGSKTKKIMQKHRNDIEAVMREIYQTFPSYTSDSVSVEDEWNIYNFDFKKEEAYSYDMPIKENDMNIEFLQCGNQIMIPVDYVEAITLNREEMYE